MKEFNYIEINKTSKIFDPFDHSLKINCKPRIENGND